MLKTNKTKRARLRAMQWHKDQKRVGGAPYIDHLVEVAELVSRVTNDEDMVCAALLHDSIEDQNKTREQIEGEFGPRVAHLVVELTDVYTPQAYPNLNRYERKVLERERLSYVSRHAQTIKLADLISNTRSIMQFDTGFAVVYLVEKEADLKVLTGGNGHLLKLAQRALLDANRSLNEM